MRTALLLTFISAVAFAPMIVFGQPTGSITGGPLVPCDGTDCDFESIVTLAERILNFLVGLGIVVSAAMFAYTGWLFFSDSGSTQNVEQGKKVFGYVVIGLVIILAAWLVVDTLLKALTDRGFNDRQSIRDQTSLTLSA